MLGLALGCQKKDEEVRVRSGSVTGHWEIAKGPGAGRVIHLDQNRVSWVQIEDVGAFGAIRSEEIMTLSPYRRHRDRLEILDGSSGGTRTWIIEESSGERLVLLPSGSRQGRLELRRISGRRFSEVSRSYKGPGGTRMRALFLSSDFQMQLGERNLQSISGAPRGRSFLSLTCAYDRAGGRLEMRLESFMRGKSGEIFRIDGAGFEASRAVTFDPGLESEEFGQDQTLQSSLRFAFGRSVLRVEGGHESLECRESLSRHGGEIRWKIICPRAMTEVTVLPPAVPAVEKPLPAPRSLAGALDLFVSCYPKEEGRTDRPAPQEQEEDPSGP